MWLFVIFLAIPMIEIALFIEIGGWLTLWPTLAIVVATAVCGTAVMRRQGLQALNDLRGAMSELRDPTAPLAHGAMILLAGALLITPGFLTDTIGLLLLVPALRRLIIRRLARNIKVATFGGTAHDAGRGPGPGPHGWHGPGGNQTIDGEFHEIDPSERAANSPSRPPSGWTRH